MQQIPQQTSTMTAVPIEGIQKILFFDEVDSTNIIAKHLAQRNEEEGTVIVAEEQTQGRGRHSRKWVSSKGGLYLSLILRPQETTTLSLLPLFSAVSIACVLESYGLHPSIKWPNDVRIGDKKIAGTLVESSMQGNQVHYVVVGIGLNIRQSKKQLPPEANATSMVLEQAKTDSMDQVLFRILENFQQVYLQWKQGKTKEIIDEWKHRSDTLGKQVRIYTEQTVLEGVAVDIDSLGRLLLTTSSGKQHTISYGDCQHLNQDGRL